VVYLHIFIKTKVSILGYDLGFCAQPCSLKLIYKEQADRQTET